MKNLARYRTTWLAILFGMAGCAEREGLSRGHEEATSPKQQTLIRANSTEPQSLDPHKISVTYEAIIIHDLLEGLVSTDSDGKVISATAADWEHEQGRVYHFSLRKDARWSNGTPVTADDFVYSWRRAVDPANGSPCAAVFSSSGIRHAGAIVRGKEPVSELGVTALSPSIVEVKLEQPRSDFLKRLSSVCFVPVYSGAVESHGENWARPGTYVGNGPFALSQWTINEKVVLKRNLHYWDHKNVRLDEVTFLPITSDKVELDRYRAGQIDITSGVPDAALDQLMQEAPGEVVIHRRLATLGIEINTRMPPLDDPQLRLALSYALDREVIAGKVYTAGNEPAYAFTPPVFPGYPHPELYGRNLTQEQREKLANKLFRDAMGPGTEVPKFRLLYVKSDTNTQFALAAASMWKRILGLEIELQALEWKSLQNATGSGKFDLQIMAYSAPVSDPFALFEGFMAFQDAQYSSEQVQALLNQARSTHKPSDRPDLYVEVERILAEDTPFIPVVFRAYPRLVKPHVRGFAPSPFGEPRSKDLWVATNTQRDQEETPTDE